MSLSKLPSGRWRAQVYDSVTGGNISAASVLGLTGRDATFPTRAKAKAAREKARAMLEHRREGRVTVAEFRDRWLTDPVFAGGWKKSTTKHYAERTLAFAQAHGDLPIDAVTDQLVADWIAGGHNATTIPTLRAMFNAARSAKAGRLVTLNPFADLGLSRTRGNKDKLPPTQEQMEAMVLIARDITPPSFAAYLEFACCTAIRPGELDALRWKHIDYGRSEIRVLEQWSSKIGDFDTPKYGPYTAALVGRAEDVLRRMPRSLGDDLFVFTTIRGTHYTPSSRTHHWNRVRAAAGLADMSLYLATRHYFGWYAMNILGLAPDVIAAQLGHKDGGKLVVQLYGHPDRSRARRLIREAHDAHGQLRPLRVVREDTA